MWRAQTIYLIIKTRKFDWLFNGHSKLSFLQQILHVSHLQHDVIEIYNIKYLCLNFGKYVEKNKVKSRNLKSMFGQRPPQRNSGKSHDYPQKENFQKYIRCWVIEYQIRKVESFDVTHALRSYLIWRYLILLKMLRN